MHYQEFKKLTELQIYDTRCCDSWVRTQIHNYRYRLYSLKILCNFCYAVRNISKI